MKLLYETEYRMRTNDFTCYDHLSPTSILDTCQDIAGTHAALLQMGFDDMYKRGYYWVVFREKITILGTVKQGSSIKAITWPEVKKGVSFVRNYKLVDEEGSVIAVGSSVWCLINTTTRRLERARDVNYDGEIHEEIIYPEIKKLEDHNLPVSQINYQVKFTDLDHNKHMNNSKYMDVFLDILDLKASEIITDVQLDFIHEAKEKDIINIRYALIDDTYCFEGYIADSLAIRAEVRVKNA